ncbi:hypothetical protein ACE01N_20570 [Saccharicrinis sp. FJH2]|uniref:hypothetical protein n=1 Tax=Saccharicrinis sp. FJH65 TaxID=3344659 RepID=UPI0035F23E2D
MKESDSQFKSFYNYASISLVFTFLLIVFIPVYKTLEKKKNETDFYSLYKIELKDRIIKKEMNHGTLSLRLRTTGIRFSCNNPYNYLLTPNNLYDCIHYNDSILKPESSYDFYIIRPEGKLKFILNRDINERFK